MTARTLGGRDGKEGFPMWGHRGHGTAHMRPSGGKPGPGRDSGGDVKRGSSQAASKGY